MPSPGMSVAGMRVDIMAAIDNLCPLFVIESRRLDCSGCELAQNVVKDAAVAEVLDLVQRVDSAHERHLLDLAVRRGDLGGELLSRLQLAGDAAQRHRLVALEAERSPRGLADEH